VKGGPNELALLADPLGVTPKTADFESLFVAQRFQRSDVEIQANAVGSRASSAGQKATANGVWIDARVDVDRARHAAGLFYLEPGLNWAGLAMNSDVQGGYYRFAQQSLRLSTDFIVEALKPVRGNTASGGFANGAVRYQLSRDVGIGGGAAFREFAGRGAQAYAYVQSRNRFGTGRAQIDVTDATTGERNESITADQTFDTRSPLRLSTSLSLSNQRASTFRRQTASMSFAGGYDFFDNLSIDLNVQGRTTLSGPKDDALYGTLGLSWYFARNWSLIANAVIGSGRFESGVILDPLAAPTLVTTRPNQRSIVIAVRYETRAGSLMAPLGGRVGGGGAPLAGVVFLDGNANGVFDANETGVANLTVILDGKFSARTDAQGRYEFPFVGAGEHVISLITDNLPLPWGVSNDGATKVNVSPRQPARVNIGAIKL
jgi:hypothetical protein